MNGLSSSQLRFSVHPSTGSQETAFLWQSNHELTDHRKFVTDVTHGHESCLFSNMTGASKLALTACRRQAGARQALPVKASFDAPILGHCVTSVRQTAKSMAVSWQRHATRSGAYFAQGERKKSLT